MGGVGTTEPQSYAALPLLKINIHQLGGCANLIVVSQQARAPTMPDTA